MFGRAAESLGRERLSNRETQELGRVEPRGTARPCSSKLCFSAWIKRLKKDPGPSEAWMLGDWRELGMGEDWVCCCSVDSPLWLPVRIT